MRLRDAFCDVERRAAVNSFCSWRSHSHATEGECHLRDVTLASAVFVLRHGVGAATREHTKAGRVLFIDTAGCIRVGSCMSCAACARVTVKNHCRCLI